MMFLSIMNCGEQRDRYSVQEAALRQQEHGGRTTYEQMQLQVYGISLLALHQCASIVVKRAQNTHRASLFFCTCGTTSAR